MNTLLLTDSYKGEHWKWANPNIAFSTGYLEARAKDSFIQVAGISRLVQKLATDYLITVEDVEEFEKFALEHSFDQAVVNVEGFRFIAEKMGGRLPIEIKALPEGLAVPSRTPVLMVRNTVPGFAWVVPYFELLWLHLWKTMDVASNSFMQKVLLTAAAEDTMPKEVFDSWINWALHDFGARSTGSNEEAEVGIGHLMNFQGSDNWIATKALYESMEVSGIPSNSVLALEHNVVLGYGEAQEHELFAEFAEYVLTQGRVGSMLIDTYDVDAAVDWVINNLEKLADWAEQGEFKGRLVLRPDSGDPTDMPVGILKKLLDIFPYTEYNGYKLLPTWLGVIQGDGNNLERLVHTCNVLRSEKISLANIVFGEGGELINNYVRDENSWAFKLSVNTTYDGDEVGCAKKPKHSPEKHSREGYFSYDPKKGITQAESWGAIEGYEVYSFENPRSLEEARKLANECADKAKNLGKLLIN